MPAFPAEHAAAHRPTAVDAAGITATSELPATISTTPRATSHTTLPAAACKPVSVGSAVFTPAHHSAFATAAMYAAFPAAACRTAVATIT